MNNLDKGVGSRSLAFHLYCKYTKEKELYTYTNTYNNAVQSRREMYVNNVDLFT
jgi:hypothetical protein